MTANQENLVTQHMKHTTLFLSLAMLLGLAPRAHAQNCSNASIAGKWSEIVTGTLLLPTGPVPVAGVIDATFSANGTANRHRRRSVGGDYANETFTGTFTVNANCRGTATGTQVPVVITVEGRRH